MKRLGAGLCLIALIGCGDDGSSEPADAGSGRCLDLSGSWTIAEHCEADLVGDEIAIEQDGCAFTAEAFGYSGTISASGAVTAERPRAGTDPITCTGSATMTALTVACAGITPPCEVRVERAAQDTGGSGGSAATGGTGGGPISGGAGGAGGSGGSEETGGSGGAHDAGGAGVSGVGIAAEYPNDEGIASDERVIFHSNFEQGLDGWTSHTEDTDRLDVIDDAALSHAGSRHLRAQVTRDDLAQDQYVSAQAQIELSRRVPQAFIRFYARFVGETATPHHWVRFAAGTPGFQSDGLANTLPSGDEGFWFDLDARRDQRFNFYVYWYEMRSGRCNDGSATPGCEGDQGNTYYYGNNFTPAEQQPFARDAWFCLEVMVKANTVGESDGELALWKDDQLVGEYKPGAPRGRWLRDNFYTWGEYFQDEQAFEGFDFRSSEDVLIKRFTLDAYYEEGSLADYALEFPVPDAQIILYDDVVIAEERVGCMQPL